jgi:hypothetical protein
MHESLPLPLRQWVSDQADKMGLPGPDSYIHLLIRLEKQRQDLQPFLVVDTAAAASSGPETT